MYIAIDEVKEQKISGWKYTTKDGDTELVDVTADLEFVAIRDSVDQEVYIYYEDIPKLVKALQAAYNWRKENII